MISGVWKFLSGNDDTGGQVSDVDNSADEQVDDSSADGNSQGHDVARETASGRGMSSKAGWTGPRSKFHKAAMKTIQSEGIPETLAHRSKSAANLLNADPELCVSLFQRSTSFTGLHKTLLSASPEWIVGFLECEGLEAIFDALEAIFPKRGTSIYLAVKQLECVMCVKDVLNCRAGLEFLIQNSHRYSGQLAKALNTQNMLVKKQVLELLSCLCAYSIQGYDVTLDTIEAHQSIVGNAHRFDFLLMELENSEVEPYTAVVLLLINCIINTEEELEDRLELRDEFVGAGLLKTLQNLRFTADEELLTQLDVLEKERAFDKEQLVTPEGVDLSNPSHVFRFVRNQVVTTPHESHFLSMLQQLLILGDQEPDSGDGGRPDTKLREAKWEVANRMLQRIVQAHSVDDLEDTCRVTVSQMKDAIGNVFKQIAAGQEAGAGPSTVGSEGSTDAAKGAPVLPVTKPVSRPKASGRLFRQKSLTVSLVSSASESDEEFEDASDVVIVPLVSVQPAEDRDSSGQADTLSMKTADPEEGTVLTGEKLDVSSPVNTTPDEDLPQAGQSTEPSSSTSPDEAMPAEEIKPPCSGVGDVSPSPTGVGDVSSLPTSGEGDVPSPPPSGVVHESPSSSGVGDVPPSQTSGVDDVPSPPSSGVGGDVTTSPPPPPDASSIPAPPSLPGMNGIPPPPPPPGAAGVPPPPPPPPPPGMAGIPPPPPLPGMVGVPPPPPLSGMGGVPPPPPPPGMGGIPPPPPPPGMGGVPPPPPPSGFSMAGVGMMANAVTRPTYTGRQPSTKLKKLNWSKLGNEKIHGPQGNNIWNSKVDGVELKEDDYKAIETLFSAQPPPSSTTGAQKKPQEKKPKTVSLVDGKTALQVGIFTRQFKCPMHQVITWIRMLQSDQLEVDQLKGLERLLPDQSVMDAIRTYNGDPDKLGEAEKLFLSLDKVPSVGIHVDIMILQHEFKEAIDLLKPDIQVLLSSIKELLSSDCLKKLFHLLLCLGNFLNHGTFSANANGFKTESILKLDDTRSNKPRVTFVHFLADYTENNCKELMGLFDEVPNLAKAARLSLDHLSGKVRSLESKIKKLDVVLVRQTEELQSLAKPFIQSATVEIKELSEPLKEIEDSSQMLKQFFCEDDKHYKLETFMETMHKFVKRIQEAVKENAARKEAEARRQKRDKAMAEEKARKAALKKEKESRKAETAIVDDMLQAMKSGGATRRSSRVVLESDAALQRLRKTMSLNAVPEDHESHADKAGTTMPHALPESPGGNILSPSRSPHARRRKTSTPEDVLSDLAKYQATH